MSSSGARGTQSKPLHKDRVKARQQRRLEIVPTKPENASAALVKNVNAPDIARVTMDQNLRAEILTDKRSTDRNVKRSRIGKGRGQAKKGGAGGKGTWGKPGTVDDLYDQSTFDENDPNYDSEGESKSVKIHTVEVLLSADEARDIIKNILVEFLDHADTDDVADSAVELNISGDLMFMFAKEALLLALDSNSDSNRELVSVLLSDLYGYSVLWMEDIERSFTELLGELDDLVLDCPEAVNMVGKFMARCVADDCLPPKFIGSRVNSDTVTGKAKEAIMVAHGLITMKHGLIVLDSIWNSEDYRKPVKHLKRKFKAMLTEYLDSLDYDNFVMSLHELGVPHFHHEIVYEMLLKCLEESSAFSAANNSEATCVVASKESENVETYLKLLQQLTTSGVVTITQFENGLKRVFEEIVDLAIDIPGAFQSLESMCSRFQREFQILSPEVHLQLKTDAEQAFKDQELARLMKESTPVVVS